LIRDSKKWEKNDFKNAFGAPLGWLATGPEGGGNIFFLKKKVLWSLENLGISSYFFWNLKSRIEF
jgi:hypothetical protein